MDVNSIVNAKAFSLEEAATSPGWLQSLTNNKNTGEERNQPHGGEAEEYGICMGPCTIYGALAVLEVDGKDPFGEDGVHYMGRTVGFNPDGSHIHGHNHVSQRLLTKILVNRSSFRFCSRPHNWDH
jgi:hypothetical protein